MKKIYLVEDEQTLSILLEKYLVHEGYSVTPFADGDTAMEHVKDTPHLWILDINLPGYNGYEIIKAIKAYHPKMPVIFMSARNEELDRVVGLELGSDDYLSKPFLPRELVIRTNKLMERLYEKSFKEGEQLVHIGDYTISPQERLVTYKGETMQLTSKEFDLMLYFLKNKNHVLSREQVLYGVWGEGYFGSDRVVDDTIRRLRKKLSHITIETIYGHGYKWVVVE
ncbi:response regulator transcription factor [Sporanaerobium hydrogeniformans]|uniref:response regulator transcription factor n=1 Tax=Sporanaerobium hydrogeniformans TaxID=3072179 RepID=UPI0026A1B3B8|nr:response regulator transcription factor [Sporanaerobium hydrogeniformans]